ncbi:uncharacterized protein TRIADDRAFT_51899 [Trichoplax adhaerens]|uniref:MAM domain-containing protein n=1 Tax=Trichoplax adhaerens TaxID=10228 RepID=B3RL70_TRIAD|nr:predicted protein [Trichoplax adhaerens]EDV29498.1 predicted protein [Trichoplax adhaerens]|eukprot:XP_002108700.1 predicted protein [Trichoplax adhaerens]
MINYDEKVDRPSLHGFSFSCPDTVRNSQHQRCQNHGNQVLLCDTLDAALRKKNEWTGFNQIILKDTTLDCHDCKLQRIVEWKNQPSHSLIGRCRLSENQLLNLQLLRKSDLRCRKIDSGTIAAACDFRSNFCKFSQEKSSDDLDWARVSGTKHDGTTGHYAYLASSQSLSNHFAQLLSPVVELPNNVQEFRVSF